MKIVPKLAFSQLKVNRGRSIWTFVGIVLSVAMITAIFGFVASGFQLLFDYTGQDSTTRGLYGAALSGITTLLVGIIVLASVIVISNAFRVSADERTTQFGILKSVGATRKQITNIVIYEALWLCLIGIPLGLALGILANYIGTNLANYMIGEALRVNNGVTLSLAFIVAWQAVIGAIAVAIGTVLLSAWLPARNAAARSAVDAIRGVGIVKAKAKVVKPSRLVNKLFGFEGELARRALKRNKRNMRATVMSLCISIVIFVAGSGIGTYIGKMTEFIYQDINAEVVVNAYGGGSSHNFSGSADLPSGAEYMRLDPVSGDNIAKKLGEYSDSSIYGVGATQYVAAVKKDNLTEEFLQNAAGTLVPSDLVAADDLFEEDARGTRSSSASDKSTNYALMLSMVFVDEKHYAELCAKAKVPYGSNILLNYYKYHDEKSRKFSQIEPLVFSKQTLRMKHADQQGAAFKTDTLEIPLHGVLGKGDIPAEIKYATNEALAILMPNSNAQVNFVQRASSEIEVVPTLGPNRYSWYAKTQDPSGFVKYANGFVHDLIPQKYELVTIGEEGFLEYMKDFKERRNNNNDGEEVVDRADRVSDPSNENLSHFEKSSSMGTVVIEDIDLLLKEVRNMSRLIMIPVYGFVIVLILIALTNIISTISNNVRSRSREFATLRSVGMTQGGLARMLSFESIMGSIKALLIGLPIGLVVSYVIYSYVSQSALFDYEFPWLTTLQCVLGVFVVMLITTWWATRRLRKGSIIDTIRTNDGM